jgi:hypothetical protein
VSTEINPIQFGQMLAELAATREELGRTRVQIDALTRRIADMESHWSRGRASLAGLVLGLGFAVLGLKQALTALLAVLRG